METMKPRVINGVQRFLHFKTEKSDQKRGGMCSSLLLLDICGEVRRSWEEVEERESEGEAEEEREEKEVRRSWEEA